MKSNYPSTLFYVENSFEIYSAEEYEGKGALFVPSWLQNNALQNKNDNALV